MQTTYHLNSAAEISEAMIKDIQIAFKGKAISITVKVDAKDKDKSVPDWHLGLAKQELEKVQNNNAGLRNWEEIKDQFDFSS